MGNTLPGRIAQAARLVLFAGLMIFILVLPAPAQEDKKASPPAEETADYQGYITKGNGFLEQGKYREAIAEFNRALLINPASDEAKRGVIKANQGIAARSAVPSTAAIEAERLNFHLTKGTEYYDAGAETYNIEKIDQAIAEWEQALQIDPENKLARSLIEAAKRAKVDLLVEKGHEEFFAGRIDEAISIWEDARKLAPSSKVLDDLIAQAQDVRHTKEEAETSAESKIQMDRMSEHVNKSGLLLRGMDADGMRRKDISEKPSPAKPKQFGKREAILKELAQPVAFEFECEPLRGVLKFLTEITGINILTDEEIFEEFGKKEDCYGNKVERNEIFVTIHVSELPLESALNGMLRQHGLGFSIERDFIYVSTPDILRGSSFEQLETRFYHLKDTSRLSLPKLDTSATTGGISLGGRSLNLASGQSLIGRVREITGNKLLEVDPDYSSLSVPKLVNILRTFVPVVLDPSKTTTGKRQAYKVGEDKQYGGMEKSQDQLKLFEISRQLWADTGGREILSLIDFDPVTNTLIVRNTPTNLDMVEVFLDNFDKEPRQISVESKFITYSLTEARAVGIDFKFAGTNTVGVSPNTLSDTAQFKSDDISEGSSINTSFAESIATTVLESVGLAGRGGSIAFRFTKADGDFLETTINLLSELSRTRVVSAPRIVTMSNKPAVIQDVLTQSFRSNLEITNNIVSVEGAAPTVSQSVEQEFTDITSGITLSITPQIQEDDTIRLWIYPDVAAIPSTDVFSVTVSGGTAGEAEQIINTVTRPQVSRQSLFTNVVVNDGDTIVIGGLIKNTNVYQKSGVPFFEDIPFFGRLFQNETQATDSQNLLIFITVNILDNRGVTYTRLK